MVREPQVAFAGSSPACSFFITLLVEDQHEAAGVSGRPGDKLQVDRTAARGVRKRPGAAHDRVLKLSGRRREARLRRTGDLQDHSAALGGEGQAARGGALVHESRRSNAPTYARRADRI